ncbi:MAG TPA: threonine/serine dehydratase, partial [Longimicrobiales bacterium]
SSGNHAQAVALTARIFGIPAVVVMPTTAPAVKVEGARRLGADVVFEGTTSIERQERAEAIAAERGLNIVPPFDHPDIIAGQGTVGLEILEDWPDVEAVLVPVGGGGLLSGTAAWIRRARPDCTIIGVEPENADAMHQSLAAGAPVTIQPRPTIADGLAPVRPGDLTFAHARDLVDDVVTVSDDAIAHAAARLLHDARLVVEFSGAAGVAALLSGRWTPGGRRTAIILSGGNRRIAEPAGSPTSA